MQSGAIVPLKPLPTASLVTASSVGTTSPDSDAFCRRHIAENKERSRLNLSRYAAEASEQAAEHRDKLSIAGKVKDIADVY